mgnify:CR=1 FL=1
MAERRLEPEDPASLPVVRSLAEAEGHDWTKPALARLEGRWLRPIFYLQTHLEEETAAGAMVRALEMLITGLVENEPCLLLEGLADATMAASHLTRPDVPG